MPAEYAGCLCPGVFSLWMYDHTLVAPKWQPLLHIDSWELEPDVEEAPRKRTSSTNGQSVKFCSDIVGYDLSVTNTICGSQWLFCQILEDHRVLSNGITTWFFASWDSDYSVQSSTDAQTAAVQAALVDTPANGGFGTPTAAGVAPDASNTISLDGSVFTVDDGDGNYALEYDVPGVMVYGQVRPPGFGGDNTGNDVSTAEWSVNTRVGPFMPNFTCNTDGTFTSNDPLDP